MENMLVVKFNPTVAELTAIVEESKKIIITDFNDKTQLEMAKKKRLLLRDYRNDIKEYGLKLRADANTYVKAVLTEEKALLAIIAPEEERLQAIEEEQKTIKLLAERLALLPERKAKLESIGGEILFDDNDLLTLDDNQFIAYYNTEVEIKNKADRIEIEEKQKAEEARLQVERNKIEEEKREIQKQKDIREAEDKAREDERQRAKDEADRKERERIAGEARKLEEAKLAEERKIEEARLAEEARLKAEKELQAKKKYQKFLADNGYNEETKYDFIMRDVDGVISLYKKVGEYKK